MVVNQEQKAAFKMKQKWLDSAVFYEVYPTSFFDSNGDGVGDINGIIEKLDYIEALGCNGIWLNPCYCSPFEDGGYDVTDYYHVDPRFGTNEEIQRLFEAAHQKGIKILLDLVMGHTSHLHPWFIESSKEEKNEFTDAYIWSDHMDVEHCEGRFMCGLSERPHMFKVNYYAMQPALNYGYYRPKASWQMPMDSPAAQKNRERLIDVCRFWLGMGADGFRVDMAHAMVKNDPHHKGTIQFWQAVFAKLKQEFPESVFLSEWNNPVQTIKKAGFDLDFFSPYGYVKASSFERDDETIYSNTYISEKSGMFASFLPSLLYMNAQVRRTDGYYVLSLGNHDTIRMSRGRSDDMIKLLWASYLTLPGVPLIYYGDEIGMRYQPLKSKDGGYQRTGARTPMQWNNEKNLGFSNTDGELYLPVEPLDSPYTVAAQEGNPDSILHTVKKLVQLKRNYSCFRATASFKPLHIGAKADGNPFIYKRDSDVDEAVIVLLPRKIEMKIPMQKYLKSEYERILQNAELRGNTLVCSGSSYAVFYRKK